MSASKPAERIAILGAGAVGLVLGARLAASGTPVAFLTRRPDQARRLREEGVRIEDPATGEVRTAPVEASAGLEAPLPRIVFFCTRASDTDEAAQRLAAVAPETLAVGAQNGVEIDALLARHFARVAGLVVRSTCTRSDDRTARNTGAGRLVVGSHDGSAGAELPALASLLGQAGFDVGVSEQLRLDRWLKLCVNLMSAPNALVVRDDHSTTDFVEGKARLLEEARAVLFAAGIETRSCDGRDRSLDEEIDYQRASLARGSSARRLPLYNQVWSALSHGGPLEADAYHRLILALAASHGVPAPVNQRALELLLHAYQGGRGPESVRAAELLAGG